MLNLFLHRIDYDDGRDSDFEPGVYKSLVRRVRRFSPSTGSSNSPITLDEDCTVR